MTEGEARTITAARASSGAGAAAFGAGASASTSAAETPRAESPPGARGAAIPESEAASACPECGAGFVGDYCHHCGEKRPEARDLSVRHFVEDAAKELTSLDSKLLRTIRVLLFKPGLLTVEWVRGRRTHYLKPLNLCLGVFAVSLFVFTASKRVTMFNFELILENERQTVEQWHLKGPGPYTRLLADASARKGEPVEALKEAINEKWQRNVSLLQPAEILFLAVLLQLVYLFSRRYFVEHLVFAMHFLAFSALTTTLMWPVYFFIGIKPTRVNMFFAGAKFLLDIFYLFVALRAVYGGRSSLAVLRALVVFGGYFVIYVFTFIVALAAALITVLVIK